MSECHLEEESDGSALRTLCEPLLPKFRPTWLKDWPLVLYPQIRDDCDCTFAKHEKNEKNEAKTMVSHTKLKRMHIRPRRAGGVPAR